jgi:hypothetical protein
VTLPADLRYRIHIDARTSFGPVALPQQAGRAGGVFSHQEVDLGQGSSTLDLNLSNGFGPVTVVQNSPNTTASNSTATTVSTAPAAPNPPPGP